MAHPHALAAIHALFKTLHIPSNTNEKCVVSGKCQYLIDSEGGEPIIVG